MNMYLFFLVGVGFFTLTEHKIMGSMQSRVALSGSMYYGYGQSLMDALKLCLKDFFYSDKVDVMGMISCSMVFIIFLLSLCSSGVWGVEVYQNSMLVFMALLIMGVYPFFLISENSTSIYANMSCMRCVCQVMSYDLVISLYVLIFITIYVSMSFNFLCKMSGFGSLGMWGGLIVGWGLCSLAESHRSPFDFSEGESELVSGFSVEYGGLGFLFIFLSEYMSLIIFSCLGLIMFLGLSLESLGGILLCVSVLYLFVWVRASVPRYRYDMLMMLGWKELFPLGLFYLVVMFFVSMS